MQAIVILINIVCFGSVLGFIAYSYTKQPRVGR